MSSEFVVVWVVLFVCGFGKSLVCVDFGIDGSVVDFTLKFLLKLCTIVNFAVGLMGLFGLFVFALLVLVLWFVVCDFGFIVLLFASFIVCMLAFALFAFIVFCLIDWCVRFTGCLWVD